MRLPVINEQCNKYAYDNQGTKGIPAAQGIQRGHPGRGRDTRHLQQRRPDRCGHQERPVAYHGGRPPGPLRHPGVSRPDTHPAPQRGGTRNALRRAQGLGPLLDGRPAGRNGGVHQGQRRIHGEHRPHGRQPARLRGDIRTVPQTDILFRLRPRRLPLLQYRGRPRSGIRLCGDYRRSRSAPP